MESIKQVNMKPTGRITKDDWILIGKHFIYFCIAIIAAIVFS